MNKIFMFFSLILWTFVAILSSCANPAAPIINIQAPVVSPLPTPAPKHYINILNSEWKIVRQEVLVSGSRDIQDTSALQSEIDAYNASHISDQWFLVDGEPVDIADAPPCDVFIVDKVTHEPLIDESGNKLSFEDWPRKQFVDNKAGWVRYAEACAADMYVDVIPPPPVPPTAEQLYAKYSVYVINNVDVIKYEFHCDVVPDGWQPMTVDQYFMRNISAHN